MASDHPIIEVYPSRSRIGARRWRWRGIARNGEIVIPVQGYTRAFDAERAVGDARALLNDPDLEIRRVRWPSRKKS